MNPLNNWALLLAVSAWSFAWGFFWSGVMFWFGYRFGKRDHK
jgi:hypothetical protein